MRKLDVDITEGTLNKIQKKKKKILVKCITDNTLQNSQRKYRNIHEIQECHIRMSGCQDGSESGTNMKKSCKMDNKRPEMQNQTRPDLLDGLQNVGAKVTHRHRQKDRHTG